MQLIQPSFEILEPQGYDMQGIYKHIELCGRTCYKSADRITEDSAEPFVQRMKDSKHYAMLEHGTVYLRIPIDLYDADYYINDAMQLKYAQNKYSRVSGPRNSVCVTTNLRVIVENGWEGDLRYMCAPTEYHIPRVSVRFICNRQVSHEFVRHRVFSFAQESTRYNAYTKEKYGSQLTFIAPCWEEDDMGQLHDTFEQIEKAYFDLINNHGWKAQQAATILPNALKTELIMTGFVDTDGWKHFFDLRAKGLTGAPHPQARQLAEPLMHEFIKRGLISE